MNGLRRIQIGGVLSVIVATWIVVAAPARAKDEPLFQSDELLKVTITGPIDDLIDARKKSKDDYSGVVTVTGDNGMPVQLKVTMRARGISRRTEFCSFPPLSIKFDKDNTKGTVFKGQKRLKLATHCQPSDNYQQLNYLEYTAYKIYNLITPVSFRVRMAEITYQDTKGHKPITRRGFFIEDAGDVGKRNGLKEIEIERPKLTQLDPKATTDNALFQFMISGLDWSVLDNAGNEACCHNGKLIGESDTGIVKPIPYDFDLTGFVHAPYALPPEQLPVSSVMTPFFRGFCRHNTEVPAALKRFHDARATIFKLIADSPYLDNSRKKDATKFIEKFYDVADDPKQVEKKITGHCR
jgi:hypothetical protein